jgi:hypothetical protein
MNFVLDFRLSFPHEVEMNFGENFEMNLLLLSPNSFNLNTTLKSNINQRRIPYITVSITQFTHTPIVTRVFWLNLLQLGLDLLLKNGLDTNLPTQMHPTITGIGGRPIPTSCTFTSHTLTYTLR